VTTKNEKDVIIIIFILWHISQWWTLFFYFLLSFTTDSSLPTVHVCSNQRQSSDIIFIFDTSLTHIKNKTKKVMTVYFSSEHEANFHSYIIYNSLNINEWQFTRCRPLLKSLNCILFLLTCTNTVL